MAEERKGFFRRLAEGLTKTRNNIVSGMDAIFSGFSDIDDDFYDEIEETRQHKFRDFEDVQRAIYQYFMIAKQEGVLSVPKKKSFFEKLFKSDVEYVSCKISSLKKAYKSKSEIMCINDGRKTTDADRRFMKEILEKKFGEKSSFEL